ncbi:XisI protein [Synechocystis sp. FACHB-383]|uniref:XisI protein n=1 Tax=Synechocystis sp. FACHB-383 TaxID=2692864 RepID=UPI001687D5AC|nr:XisI protein [Synechocystis sp. FACHB-383]MBD2652917.1 XisI protein [Synechocystis sp. FACHB-383]
MDRLAKHRQIIEKVLTPYANISYTNAEIQNRLVIDETRDQYLIISEGWQRNQRYHSVLIHLEIIDGKLWIQCDNTEDGIATELVSSGIAKEEIVLGFHEPQIRPYTGFAVA